MAVSIKLYVFAYLRDKFGVNKETQITLTKSEWESVEELKCEILDLLSRLNPNHQDRNNFQVNPSTILLALNEEFAYPGSEIKLIDGDTVALIPPISGG